MQSPIIKDPITRQRLTYNKLPLAVYREVAAHLRQVDGVDASLIMRPIDHDPKEKFDYYQSQVAAMEVRYMTAISDANRQTAMDILEYYGQRYQPWHSLDEESDNS